MLGEALQSISRGPSGCGALKFFREGPQVGGRCWGAGQGLFCHFAALAEEVSLAWKAQCEWPVKTCRSPEGTRPAARAACARLSGVLLGFPCVLHRRTLLYHPGPRAWDGAWFSSMHTQSSSYFPGRRSCFALFCFPEGNIGCSVFFSPDSDSGFCS